MKVVVHDSNDTDERGIYQAVFVVSFKHSAKSKKIETTKPVKGVYCPARRENAITRQIRRSGKKHVTGISITILKRVGTVNT